MDLAKDLWFAVTALFGNVGALVALGVVVVITVTHSADNAEGAIHTWAKNYPNNSIIVFASTHLARLIGLLAFCPAFMLIPRRSFPAMVVAATSLVLTILPEAHFYQYLVLSGLLHLFLHARLPSTRIIVVATFGVYVLFVHKLLAGVSHPSEHFDNFLRGSNTTPGPSYVKRQVSAHEERAAKAG